MRRLASLLPKPPRLGSAHAQAGDDSGAVLRSVSDVTQRDLTVLRFAVVSPDGRRSCEWRVWTGSRKPTNEVYMAPRSMGGELKLSIHSDGWCQHGLTGGVRASLR